MTASLTVHLEDSSKIEMLDKLAKSMDQSRNWVINRAIEHYMMEQSRDLEAILEGIAQADRGEFASKAEVEAAFARFGAESAKSA
jgi:predicted transcriptional regulator